MGDEIPYEHRYVASEGSGKAMARSFVVYAFRQRTMWLFLSALFVVFSALLMTGYDPDQHPTSTLVISAMILAVIPTALLAVLLAAVAYLRTLRSARVRVFPGAVIESGFGTDAMALRGPSGSSVVNYRVVRSIQVRGDHVFFRQKGIPLVSIFPRELFPDAAIETVRAGILEGAGPT